MSTDAQAVAVETFEQTLDLFIAHLEGRGRCSKYRRLTKTAIKAAADYCQWTTIHDVSPRSIDAYMTKLASDGKSGRTQNLVLGYLSSMLSWCLRTERVNENAARKITKAHEFRGEGSDAFTPAEAHAVIMAAKRDAESPRPRFGATHRWALYTVLWYTGLRISEAHALKWHDIRLEGTPRIVIPPRTAKAKKAQEVPLHPSAIQALRAIMPPGVRPVANVFPFVHERCINADMDAAKLDRTYRRLGFHSFRSGLATELANQNVHPRVAQEVLRHSDVRLTMRAYTKTRHLPISQAINSVTAVGCAGEPKNLHNPSCKGVDFGDNGGAQAEVSMHTTQLHPNQQVPGREAGGSLCMMNAQPEQPAAPGPAPFGLDLRAASRPGIAGAGFESTPATPGRRAQVKESANASEVHTKSIDDLRHLRIGVSDTTVAGAAELGEILQPPLQGSGSAQEANTNVATAHRGSEETRALPNKAPPGTQRDIKAGHVPGVWGSSSGGSSSQRLSETRRDRMVVQVVPHEKALQSTSFLTLSWCLPESVTEAARACGVDGHAERDCGDSVEADARQQERRAEAPVTRRTTGAGIEPGHHERPSTRSGIDAAPGSATQRPGAPSHDNNDDVRAGAITGSSVSYAKRDTDHPVGDGAEQRRQVRSDANEVSPGPVEPGTGPLSGAYPIAQWVERSSNHAEVGCSSQPGGNATHPLPSLAAATHAMVGAALPLCSTEGRALGSGEYGGSHPPMRFDSATSDREKRPAGVEPGHRVTLTTPAAGQLVHVDPAPPSYDPIAFTRYCMSQAENAQRQGRNRLMRKWMRASAAVLIAAGTSIAALRPTDGYWCYLYHCSLAKSVSECILCCFAFCYPPSQLESECQDACTGGMSRMEVQNLVVYELAQRVVRVSAATTNEHAETVSMMIGAAMCNDEVIARRVMVMANDLPLECDRNEVRAAYERRHGEQGDI